MTFFTGAVTRHRLFSPSGYNVPKSKFMFYVSFVTQRIRPGTVTALNFAVKNINRINVSYDVQELNQYNKKRLVQNKIQYGPLNMSLHDLRDEPVLKMIEAYNRFYYGDFDNKNNQSWSYDTVGSNFEFTPNWGLKGRLSGNEQYFFDRIEIYEIYDQVYTQVNFINPVFTAVEFGNLDQTSTEGNDVSINCKYEGIKIQAASSIVTPDLARKFGLPYRNNLLLPTGFTIPGLEPDSPLTPYLSSAASGIFNQVFNVLGPDSLVGNFGTNVLNNVLLGNGLSGIGVTAAATAIDSLFGSRAITPYGTDLILDSPSEQSTIFPSLDGPFSAESGISDVVTGTISNVFSSILRG